MVTVDKLGQGLANYLDAEFMTKLPSTGVKKFMVGMAATLVIKRMDNIIYALESNRMLQMLGVFNNAGEIDIDILKEVAIENMPKEGLKVNIPGIGPATFNTDDVDKLYEYITM